MKAALLTDDYCRRLVLKRLCALDYATMDDFSGGGSDSWVGGGSPSIANVQPAEVNRSTSWLGGGSPSIQNVDPWTGSGSSILDPWVGGGSPSIANVTAPSSTDAGGWLSGLASLGTSVTNIVRAISPPKTPVSTWVNPQTGLPYGLNPQTGMPYASTQTQSIVTLAFWVLLAFLAFRLLSKTG